MNYSVAERYSRIFSVLSDPYALMVLDHMFENRKSYTPEELADLMKSTTSKVRGILEKLRDSSIVSRDFRDESYVYEVTDYQYANFIEAVIERID